MGFTRAGMLCSDGRLAFVPGTTCEIGAFAAHDRKLGPAAAKPPLYYGVIRSAAPINAKAAGSRQLNFTLLMSIETSSMSRIALLSGERA